MAQTLDLDALGEPVEVTVKLYIPKKLYEFGQELYREWHVGADFNTAVNIELIQQLLAWLDDGWGFENNSADHIFYDSLVKKTGLDEKTIRLIDEDSWKKAHKYLRQVRKV